MALDEKRYQFRPETFADYEKFHRKALRQDRRDLRDVVRKFVEGAYENNYEAWQKKRHFIEGVMRDCARRELEFSIEKNPLVEDAITSYFHYLRDVAQRRHGEYVSIENYRQTARKFLREV
jgi:hypothetical protein